MLNGDCDNALCLDTPDGSQCARPCTATCPDGFQCKNVAAGGGDVIGVCVAKWGRRCDPCQKSAQCQGPGHEDAACVKYGPAGAFCGAPCANDGDCGAGYGCRKVTSIEGSPAQQCIKLDAAAADFGPCPCSKAAAGKALATACQVEFFAPDGSVAATCGGFRACGADGLSPCSAPPPKLEVCNGKDDDCDGQTDEATCADTNPCTKDLCVPGTDNGGCQHPPADGLPCDDGNPCTQGDVCQDAACKAVLNACDCTATADCKWKEDGDLCNGTLVCDVKQLPHKCVVDPATEVTCTGAAPMCNTVACDAKTGQCVTKPLPDGGGCDDGVACTVGDVCLSGKCASGKDVCQCQGDGGCPDDGDLCNGAPYCDKTGFPWACKTNLKTVIVCSKADDSACKQNQCDPKSGQCKPTNVPANTPCNADDNACTVGDACQQGQCVAGTNLCDCKADADCGSKEDGDLCNGTLYCDLAKGGKCELNPATVVQCPSALDTDCAKSTCSKTSGKCEPVPLPDGTTCSDANQCTAGDSCQKGVCQGSANTCNCADDKDCLAQDDGDLCNGTLYCDKGKGQCVWNPATVVVCATVDDSACAKAVCVAKTGKCELAAAVTGTACDDGSPCTQGDHCADGSCQPGKSTCKCKTDADCASQDDGDLCNGVLYCNKALGQCQPNPASVVVCQTGLDGPCEKTTCQPATGKCVKLPVNQGQPCDDGDPCSQGDWCHVGACKAGGNVCPCDKSLDCLSKDDGDLCNGVFACTKVGVGTGCVFDPKSVVQCSKANDTACLKSVCQPKSGVCALAAVATGTGCDDGEPCTVGDACAAGSCAPGKNTCPCLLDQDCDDKLARTLDVCGKAKGCAHTANDAACLDANPCTLDQCDVAKGCVGLPVQATCSDGNPCTDKDLCEGGTCLGKVAVVCDDKNPCTDDACDLAKGCTATANTAKCDDGDLCTVADGCKAGVCAGGGKLDCSDGNACTEDLCGKATGCAWKVANCDDGNSCTKDSCDKAGVGCKNEVTAGLACDDGNPCTQQDVCGADGACKAGKVVVDCDKGPCVKGKEEWGTYSAPGNPYNVYDMTADAAGAVWLAGNTMTCDPQPCHLAAWLAHATKDGPQDVILIDKNTSHAQVSRIAPMSNGNLVFAGYATTQPKLTSYIWRRGKDGEVAQLAASYDKYTTDLVVALSGTVVALRHDDATQEYSLGSMDDTGKPAFEVALGTPDVQELYNQLVDIGGQVVVAVGGMLHSKPTKTLNLVVTAVGLDSGTVAWHRNESFLQLADYSSFNEKLSVRRAVVTPAGTIVMWLRFGNDEFLGCIDAAGNKL